MTLVSSRKVITPSDSVEPEVVLLRLDDGDEVRVVRLSSAEAEHIARDLIRAAQASVSEQVRHPSPVVSIRGV